MKQLKNLALLILGLSFVFLNTSVSWAVPAAPQTYTIAQPDGTNFQARGKGDEWHNWTETEDGYTIIKDTASGYWEYAVPAATDKRAVLNKLSSKTARLFRSGLKVGIDAPVGIEKGLIPRRVNSQADPFRQSIQAFGPFTGNKGNQNTLVILVNFADKALSTTEVDWNSKFFGATQSVKDYFDEVSYGNLNIVPAAETSGTANNGIVVVTLASNHPNTGSTTDIRNQNITRDALIAADAVVDFSSFDTDGNGAISNTELHLVVIPAGYEYSYGGSSTCTPSVWGHRWSLSNPVNLDGITVGAYAFNGGYMQFGELHATIGGGCGGGAANMATIGIMVHELGHDLSLPDEYDTDGSSAGIGSWGIMGAGSWNWVVRPGDSPAHPSPWDKSYQGWITPRRVNSATLPISQVDTSGVVYQLLDNPGGIDWTFTGTSGTGEYFLIENRQKVGYDAGLPACGILIWHIDETVPGNNTANQQEWGRRLLAVEQADGLFDLEYNRNRGDAGDTYLAGSIFNDASNPNSRLYNGSSSNVSISISSACGVTMQANMTDPSFTQPAVYISSDKFSYTTGETLQLSPQVVAGGTATTADAYIRVVLPDGTPLYLDALNSAPAPVAASWTVTDFGPQVYFSYPFDGSEPIGQYKFEIYLTVPGTGTIIGQKHSTLFNFTP